jgi:hypothetical protein
MCCTAATTVSTAMVWLPSSIGMHNCLTIRMFATAMLLLYHHALLFSPAAPA